MNYSTAGLGNSAGLGYTQEMHLAREPTQRLSQHAIPTNIRGGLGVSKLLAPRRQHVGATVDSCSYDLFVCLHASRLSHGF